MVEAYLNRVATAVPPHDVHRKFVEFVPQLLNSARDRALFARMAQRAQIEHRYSFLSPHANAARMDAGDFYRPGHFPNTESRMRFYERHTFALARSALDGLEFAKIKNDITHLIITTCTGFYAPGVDVQVVDHYRLAASIERTVIGFMGCSAGMNALKLARHIVRSEPRAKVAILNLELCTLHLQETQDLEQMLSFLVFADGGAASLVSAEPVGLRLDGFHSAVIPATRDQITWHIGGLGFDMVLSGRVPKTIMAALPDSLDAALHGRSRQDIRHWAVHPGGRSVLQAVQQSLQLPESALGFSRDVLRRFGNMSSATIMFVLKEMMQAGQGKGHGCAMAFGPGVTLETMLFMAG
ncbi:MAG: type III polyketide synthase [Proteobacteria bacterium]|nr:type III polyketide synthase [Pseudomonadota bacterium]